MQFTFPALKSVRSSNRAGSGSGLRAGMSMQAGVPGQASAPVPRKSMYVFRYIIHRLPTCDIQSTPSPPSPSSLTFSVVTLTPTLNLHHLAAFISKQRSHQFHPRALWQTSLTTRACTEDATLSIHIPLGLSSNNAPIAFQTLSIISAFIWLWQPTGFQLSAGGSNRTARHPPQTIPCFQPGSH